jgi:predicted RNA-binding Zn ribbon-like protein
VDTVALLNTVRADRGGVHDDLADASPRRRALRDALRVLAADRTHDPRPVAEGHAARVGEAVATLNAVAALAPGWPTLVGGRRVWASAVEGEDRELADAAAEAVQFFAGDAELRACLAPGCVLYFVKDHPRKAWCSVGCGNRERAARHYARHR